MISHKNLPHDNLKSKRPRVTEVWIIIIPMPLIRNPFEWSQKEMFSLAAFSSELVIKTEIRHELKDILKPS